MPRCWGPEHRAHTTPHTRQPRPTRERQRCAPALKAPPPQGPPTARAPTHTGTAVSPSRQRLDEVRGSSAVLAAVRPDNQGGYPVEPVWYGHTGRGSPPLAQAEIQTKPNPPGGLRPTSTAGGGGSRIKATRRPPRAFSLQKHCDKSATLEGILKSSVTLSRDTQCAPPLPCPMNTAVRTVFFWDPIR